MYEIINYFSGAVIQLFDVSPNWRESEYLLAVFAALVVALSAITLFCSLFVVVKTFTCLANKIYKG